MKRLNVKLSFIGWEEIRNKAIELGAIGQAHESFLFKDDAKAREFKEWYEDKMVKMEFTQE